MTLRLLVLLAVVAAACLLWLVDWLTAPRRELKRYQRISKLWAERETLRGWLERSKPVTEDEWALDWIRRDRVRDINAELVELRMAESEDKK